MKDDIDYTEKIKTFNLLVGNNNEEIALNYLTISNWDEDQAAMLYNKENKGADAKLINNNNLINPNNINNNFIPNNNNLDFIPIDYYNFDPPQIINPNAKNNTVKYNSKINTYPHCKIYTKGFFDGIKLWKVDNRGYYESYFKQFENKLKLFKYYDTFINNLKTNIGIIYIYDKSNINTGLNVFRNFINNQQVKELLQKRCIVHPMVNKCCEASDIIKTFKINHFPVMVICFYKNENYAQDIIVKLGANGRTFRGVYADDTRLTLDTDYTISANEITLKKEFLTALPNGENEIRFDFDRGLDPTVKVNVSTFKEVYECESDFYFGSIEGWEHAEVEFNGATCVRMRNNKIGTINIEFPASGEYLFVMHGLSKYKEVTNVISYVRKETGTVLFNKQYGEWSYSEYDFRYMNPQNPGNEIMYRRINPVNLGEYNILLPEKGYKCDFKNGCVTVRQSDGSVVLE